MRSRVIHPFLFAIFPVFFLFSYNVGELLITGQSVIIMVGIPTMIILCLTGVLWGLLKVIFTDIHKTGILVSIGLMMFFSCGHFHNLIAVQLGYAILFNVKGFMFGPYKLYFLICAATLPLITYFLRRTHRNLSTFTYFLNIFASILIGISLVNLMPYGMRRIFLWKNVKAQQEIEYNSTDLADRGIGEKLPDIYYIILDEYAASSTLNELFNYDNQEFLEYLHDRGFYVASKSLCNYPFTVLSLASSLNLKYINEIGSKIKISEDFKSNDIAVPVQMVQNNKVMHLLKSKGYTFIHFRSGYPPTEQNSAADWDIQCDRTFIRDRFLKLLIRTTMIEPFFRYYAVASKRETILCQFSKLTELDKIEEPIFVFAHLMIPHEPYVFGANGEKISAKDITSVETEKKLYLNQLIFTNEKVKTLIDTLLLDSEASPIIILQSDHGKRLRPQEQNIRAWMRILNAYYLPQGGNAFLYESITPVNTFRIIFNYYFGDNYELLKDQSYFLDGAPYHYNFVDVTDRARYH